MIILQALYFFLPAYLANMAPVFAAKILGKRFDNPIDCGAKFRGQRVLGDHKTWRGLVSGVLMGFLVAYLQTIAAQKGWVVRLNLLDYSQVNPIILGGLLGLGTIVGDAVKSFFKRQMKIAPGGKWPGFDQLDFVIGGLLFVSMVYVPPLIVILILLIATPGLHLLSNIIGYKLKLKENPW